MTGRRFAAATVGVALGLAASCGGGGDDASPGTSASSSSTPPTATSGPATTGPGPSPSTGTNPSDPSGTSSSGLPPASSGSTAPGPSGTGTTAPIPGPAFVPGSQTVNLGFPGTNELATLQAVRVGHQPGFDRVVFEFGPDDALPGVLVGPRALPITQDPSDLPVEVGGDRALLVRMQAASRAEVTAAGEFVLRYQSPLSVSGDTAVVVDVVWSGDFEALLSWAIGLNGEHPYRVFTLSGPPRVVVDVQTPPAAG